jgi:site-specific DNA-methyltransferase (adenine-specific)
MKRIENNWWKDDVMKYQILQGDNRDTLKTIADNSIDAIITDPPYGIDFLGKSWDANTGALETYQECLRVLKPGGHILAFSAARTYHHLAITLEQAGFEIRDQIMWLYSSGFPKAQDIGKSIQKRQGVEKTIEKEMIMQGGFDNWADTQENKTAKRENQTIQQVVPTSPEAKQWAGWKTALKPAHEPICMARKPFKGSTIDNVLAHGVGALNIDETRIPYSDDYDAKHQADISKGQSNATNGTNFFGSSKSVSNDEGIGRFPSNVIGEIDGYQKFFYCPKVSRAERHIGFDNVDYSDVPKGLEGGLVSTDGGLNHKRAQHIKDGNNHPTVKPVELMKYLIKLVTPENSIVLDPFCGSGSTGVAAVELGHEFIGCELDPNYVSIAETRIRAWNTPDTDDSTIVDSGTITVFPLDKK